MRVIFIIIFCNICSQAFAEYRVYQYYTHSIVQNLTANPYELITSTLNPIAYKAYHGGPDTLEVNLLRSWVCKGNTARKEICTISDGNELESKLKEAEEF